MPENVSQVKKTLQKLHLRNIAHWAEFHKQSHCQQKKGKCRQKPERTPDVKPLKANGTRKTTFSVKQTRDEKPTQYEKKEDTEMRDTLRKIPHATRSMKFPVMAHHDKQDRESAETV